MKLRVFMVAVAAMLATSGCGLTASPADNIAFTAPQGWTSSPGIAGFMQFWRSPRESEVLMLFRSPKPIKSSDVFQSASLRDAKIEAQKDISICDGAQQAQLVDITAKTDRNGQSRDVDATMVMSTTGGNTYFAVYARPVELQPDSQAVAATRELCPKK
jgi:hypothetical protein